MKIAFINKKGKVGGHIGHAKVITIYDEIDKSFTNHSPQVTGGSGRSRWLSESGVSCIILNGAGADALKHLSNLGISVLDGRDNTIGDALDMFLSKKLGVFIIENSLQKESKHGECCEGENCSKK